MARIIKLPAQPIDQALKGVTRQYLVGDLQKPQALSHIPSDLVEIGITRYGAEGGSELPHRHRQAFESQYMLSGTTAYLDTEAREGHVFNEGDFFPLGQTASYAPK